MFSTVLLEFLSELWRFVEVGSVRHALSNKTFFKVTAFSRNPPIDAGD
jgi:hypothetical protein